VELVEQAWQMGESELILIHGNGRNRDIFKFLPEEQKGALTERLGLKAS
jgi:hypothetical protein